MKYLILLLITFSLSSALAIEFGFSSGVTTLATANVRQTITASLVKAPDLIIQNPVTNSVSIFLGGSDVTTSGVTQGTEILPGAAITLTASGKNNVFSSSRVFIVSTGTAVPVVIGRVTLN